jgi:hypothetical protein
MSRKTIRRQKPILGGREPLPSCVIKSIREKVSNLALRYSVSRSFVIAVLLADALNIKEQERF